MTITIGKRKRTDEDGMPPAQRRRMRLYTATWYLTKAALARAAGDGNTAKDLAACAVDAMPAEEDPDVAKEAVRLAKWLKTDGNVLIVERDMSEKREKLLSRVRVECGVDKLKYTESMISHVYTRTSIPFHYQYTLVDGEPVTDNMNLITGKPSEIEGVSPGVDPLQKNFDRPSYTISRIKRPQGPF